MKRFHLKIFICITVLLQASCLFSQEINKLEHLENRLQELRNTNPDETIKIGEYILKHSSSDTQKSNTLTLMSFAYFAKKDTQKSTELLFKAKELAEATKDAELITKVYGTIAQMYLKIGFKDKAVEYLHQTIKHIQNLPEGNEKHMLKGLSYIELGKINLEEKKYNKANVYFKNSLAEFNMMKANSLYFIKRSYYNLGDSFYGWTRPDSAQFYLKKALAIQENPIVNQYALFTLSKIYTDKKEYQKAIDTLGAILKHNGLKDDGLKSEIYLSLSKNYNALGNTEKYNMFNEKYLELHNEILDNNLSTIKNAVNIEEKNLTTKITSADKQNNRLLFIIFFICCIAAAILVYVRQKKKIQKKQYEAVIALLEKKAKNTDPIELTEPLKEAGSQPISPKIEQAILEKLTKFEQSDKFTNPKLNISTLSIQLKTNTTYLSQTINKYKEKNFSAYINELRINYICKQIHNNPEYLNYKISYLGELAGFTSHSTFTTIFKNVTGMAPSTFLKEAEKRNKQKTNY